MNDHEYHRDTRIGRSGLHEFARSPRHYFTQYLDPEFPRKAPTPSMRLGSAVHSIILESDSFADKYAIEPERWPTKAECGVSIEQQKADFGTLNADKTIITAEQYVLASSMRASVLTHPAAKLLLSAGTPERTLLYDHPLTGSPAKAKLDWDSVAQNGLIVDLKTASDASESEFAKSAVNYWYHVQAAWYMDAYETATGEPAKGFVFIVVENTAPHLVAVYFATPEMIVLGRNTYEPILRRYEQCRQSATWPGYGDEIKPLTLPAWAFKQ
jgi:exodeoxyribonuclease VIII